ncbi:MAG: hypothetical protein ABIQ70_05865, partial [Dokdonella sp.]
ELAERERTDERGTDREAEGIADLAGHSSISVTWVCAGRVPAGVLPVARRCVVNCYAMHNI